MQETVRYTYRVRPGANAVSALMNEWHMTRFLWNESATRMKAGETVSFAALGKMLTAKRAELDWKAADNAVAQTKRLLIEKAERAGRTVVIVPPAYTTMTCSNCGTIAKTRLSLSERTFRCECGYTADRDLNAAQMILALAEVNQVGVDGVSRPERTQVLDGAT